MNLKDPLEQILNLALVKIKEANINILTRPEELKSLFKEALSKKSPYWELNPDSDRLTKLGLVFKTEPGHIDKGKPIYVSLKFENSALAINLEEQQARTTNNTFRIPYQILLNSWDEFYQQFASIFQKAQDWANGSRSGTW